MLSRRDKLLIQPWEERRYKDHRLKVQSALPAIDTGAPASRPHVALKLKKAQREGERARSITRDNFALLQRLSAIMRLNRLDNKWLQPLPNFQHKVGMFYSPSSLQSRLTARSSANDSRDDSYANVRCYACEQRKKSSHLYKTSHYQESLPSIYSN